jgi:two-component system response regulator FixJ
MLCSVAPQEKPKVVVIVDDDELVRSSVQGLIEVVGVPVLAFASAEEFLNSGDRWRTGCLITDIRLPGISGLELQSNLNKDHCKIPIIFITAHGDEDMRMQALRAGAVEFLTKPLDGEALLRRVRAALNIEGLNL